MGLRALCRNRATLRETGDVSASALRQSPVDVTSSSTRARRCVALAPLRIT